MIDDDVVIKKSLSLFSALSNNARMKIVILLFDGKMNVQDMQQIIEISQSAMSHHLSLLKNSELIKSERDGHFMYYELSDNHARSLIELAFEHALEKVT